MTVSENFDGGQFFDIVSCSYGTRRDWCQQAQGMKPTKARFGGANSAILATLPDIVGCTVNRHPSQSLWSTRYFGHPCKCASWNLVPKSKPLEYKISWAPMQVCKLEFGENSEAGAGALSLPCDQTVSFKPPGKQLKLGKTT